MAPRRACRPYPLVLSLLFLLPAMALAPLVALGEGPNFAANGSRKGSDAASPSREYLAVCTQGNTKYVAHDVEGAMALYRKAIDAWPTQGLAHDLLGEAELGSGNLAEAAASWIRALDATLADPALHARVLFVTADLKERQKKWDEAKTAWQAYIDWAREHSTAHGFPATGLSRQQTLDAVINQDKTYEVVRQRIAAGQDGGVFSDPSKSSPSK